VGLSGVRVTVSVDYHQLWLDGAKIPVRPQPTPHTAYANPDKSKGEIEPCSRCRWVGVLSVGVALPREGVIAQDYDPARSPAIDSGDTINSALVIAVAVAARFPSSYLLEGRDRGRAVADCVAI
jgi:hypothetical protein